LKKGTAIILLIKIKQKKKIYFTRCIISKREIS